MPIKDEEPPRRSAVQIETPTDAQGEVTPPAPPTVAPVGTTGDLDIDEATMRAAIAERAKRIKGSKAAKPAAAEHGGKKKGRTKKRGKKRKAIGVVVKWIR